VRLWSLHPKYLDARGLVALWREGLLAQAVLKGRTRGYRHHPQLARFQAQPAAIGLIAEYLRIVCDEATQRGYAFDAGKIDGSRTDRHLAVTRGQIRYEWDHLQKKLAARDPRWRCRWTAVGTPLPHPLFRLRAGSVAAWEKRT
jgi:hypothetical protein